MSFFRNPEVKKDIIIWALCSLMATLIGTIYEFKVGIGILALCLFFLCYHFYETYKRYEKIADLSMEIDKILYDCSKFDLSRFSEGELAVLHSEIYKMTIRLREQAENLQKDKVYLADSLADISHQIKTPLTSINLLLEFLNDPELEETEKSEILKELRILLGKIDWLVQTLLKISRLDAGTLKFEYKKIKLYDLVENSYRNIAVSMDLRNQKFTFQCEPEITMEGDYNLTIEAVSNILKNCMEHTQTEGQIKVMVKDTGIYTEIQIEDNGPGISDADLPHIFQRFYKGIGSESGSVGIGLAYAKMIITAENGTIKAKNKLDGGALFIIKFYKSIV